jgi:hypothetical protein
MDQNEIRTLPIGGTLDIFIHEMKFRWKQFALKCPKDRLFILNHCCVLFKPSKSIESVEFLLLISTNFCSFKMYNDREYCFLIILNPPIYHKTSNHL